MSYLHTQYTFYGIESTVILVSAVLAEKVEWIVLAVAADIVCFHSRNDIRYHFPEIRVIGILWDDTFILHHLAHMAPFPSAAVPARARPYLILHQPYKLRCHRCIAPQSPIYGRGQG